MNNRMNGNDKSGTQAKPKVLVVDDLSQNIIALEAIVGRSDLQLLTANSGPEALEIVLQHDIALALIDPTTGEPERSFAPRIRTTVELDGSVRQVLLDGLVGVTTDGEGTATRVFAGMPAGFAVAGKTGTAQVGGRASSSVFAGFAPLEEPRYSWAIIVEQGGYGSAVSAPIARRILEPLALRDTQNMPLPTTPLPGQEVQGEIEIEIQESEALD